MALLFFSHQIDRERAAMGLFGNKRVSSTSSGSRAPAPLSEGSQDTAVKFRAGNKNQRPVPNLSSQARSPANAPAPKADFSFSERCEEAMDYAKFLAGFNGTKFDKPVERAALKAWFAGRTAPLELGPNFLGRINAYVHSWPGNIGKDPLHSERYDPPGSYRRRVRFGAYGADPNFDALLGSATVIFDRQGNAIGLEDSFDFNGGPKYGPITNWAMRQVRAARSSQCGTSGDFRITAGSGR